MGIVLQHLFDVYVLKKGSSFVFRLACFSLRQHQQFLVSAVLRGRNPHRNVLRFVLGVGTGVGGCV